MLEFTLLLAATLFGYGGSSVLAALPIAVPLTLSGLSADVALAGHAQRIGANRVVGMAIAQSFVSNSAFCLLAFGLGRLIAWLLPLQ